MQDDLIALAKRAGAATYTNRHYPDRTVCAFGPEKLQAFVELIRKDEREQCAALGKTIQCTDIMGAHSEYTAGKEMAVMQFSAAISARTTT